ncbi:MAG: hypothetical protein AB8G95_20730 [Anaerolineae bacterium]
MRKSFLAFILTLVTLVIVSCRSAEEIEPASIPTDVPATEISIATSTPLPETTEPLEQTVQPEQAQENGPTAESVVLTEQPSQTSTPEPVPTLHPAEALIQSFSQPSQTNGDLLVLYGQVLDVNGAPIPNATVEIWQTDASGVYDHPNDPGTGTRDITFQFFGSATSDSEGWYAFRTILPGKYEPRPRHIHFKVKQNGSTVLTSQFYFSDDVAEVEEEGMFRAVGDSGDLLLLQLIQNETGPVLANGRIVIDTGIGSGDLPLTPSQAEGPYYPIVTVAEFNNDLAILSD